MRSQYHPLYLQQKITKDIASTTYDTALARLRSLRPCVRPNLGFAKQLQGWFACECDTPTLLRTVENALASDDDEETIDISWSLWSTVPEAGRVKITRNEVLRDQGLLEDLDWTVLESDPPKS